MKNVIFLNNYPLPIDILCRTLYIYIYIYVEKEKVGGKAGLQDQLPGQAGPTDKNRK